ncbi:XRE family transcriptional regulator [Lutibacter sp. B1]|uniref:helix-turn-helix domain-containing protein n=1 Tax=Lutibacter sp. B1 TaxID=2725996 RepID=UPI0014578BF1|nr:XRE family transcriptional regulator [Lutibacter sp. B1]NLP57094.1 helix-turn-helix domain-containing protein [Lutibacter sp. B1]
MDDYLLDIGKQIKKIRKKKQLIISEVATKAGVSNGLISRIENGRTIPSLPVLLNIIGALEIELSSFFDGMEKINGKKFIVTRKNEYSEIEKEVEAEGFVYKFIFNKSLSSIGFEAVLLEVLPNSKRDKVTTDAYEFKYMLSGKISYIIDNEEIEITEGDSLFFDGRFPHVPINKDSEPAKMLVLYFFNETELS